MIISEQEKRRIKNMHRKNSIIQEQVSAETKICIPMKEIEAAVKYITTTLQSQKAFIGEECVNYEDFKMMFEDQIGMFCNPADTNPDWVINVETPSDDEEMEDWH